MTGVHAVWHQLSLVPRAAVLVALLLALFQVACQACRLWAILPRAGAVSIPRAAHAFTLGEWANIFTPARAGDALKVLLLNRRPPQLSLATATGAIVADKVVDIGSLLLLCAVSGAAGTLWASARTRLPLAVIALAIGAAVIALFLGVRWAIPRMLELTKGLAGLGDARRVLPSVTFSLGAWLAELFALSVLCTALSVPQPLPHLVLALALLNAGVSVPVSPGNVGIYEGVLAFGLTQAGVATPAAVAIATLHHGLELAALNIAAAIAAIPTI